MLQQWWIWSTSDVWFSSGWFWMAGKRDTAFWSIYYFLIQVDRCYCNSLHFISFFKYLSFCHSQSVRYFGQRILSCLAIYTQHLNTSSVPLIDLPQTLNIFVRGFMTCGWRGLYNFLYSERHTVSHGSIQWYTVACGRLLLPTQVAVFLPVQSQPIDWKHCNLTALLLWFLSIILFCFNTFSL